jgi:hypothetical protein
MPTDISKSRAMTLMGIESSQNGDDMRDMREQKLFEWKQEVLQKYMVPALLRKKQSLLEEMIAAEKLLLDESHSNEFRLDIPALSKENRIDMLEQYEASISSLKLALTQCSAFIQIKPIIDSLIRLQDDYMHNFQLLFSGFSEALPEEVKSREMIDTGKLLHALKQGEPDNKMVWAIELELTRIKKIEGIR